MNIITFATPVSVAPPKLWAVSLYTNTLSKYAFEASKVAILQLLTTKQSTLVPILGKRSGYELDFSKRDECCKRGYPWTFTTIRSDESGPVSLDVLPECASYIVLQLMSSHAAGDHDVALCQVIGTGKWNHEQQNVDFLEGGEPPFSAKDHNTVLYTAQLRKEGII